LPFNVHHDNVSLLLYREAHVPFSRRDLRSFAVTVAKRRSPCRIIMSPARARRER
jgi:hypothetical protein